MADDRQKATSLATINKAIGSIARSAVKLNETIHNTAQMCAEHAKTYGDTDQCARLVDAMPMSHRRSLLIQWFDAFTPIGIGKDNKTGKMKGHLKGKAEERDAMWNLAPAKATPFYAMPDVEREPEVPTYDDIHTNVVSFVKRLETMITKGSGNKLPMPEGEEKNKALAEVEALKQAIGR